MVWQGPVGGVFRGALRGAAGVSPRRGFAVAHVAKSGHFPARHPGELPAQEEELHRCRSSAPNGPLLRSTLLLNTPGTLPFRRPSRGFNGSSSLCSQTWTRPLTSRFLPRGRAAGAPAAARSPTPPRAPPNAKARFSPSTDQVRRPRVGGRGQRRHGTSSSTLRTPLWCYFGLRTHS